MPAVPPPRDRIPLPHLLREVARVSGVHPFDRKLLLCDFPAQGRELLRAAAGAGIHWMGWEVVSVRQLARELVAPGLAQRSEDVADDFDLLAALDEAVDAVEAEGKAGPFGEAGVGLYRDAIHQSIRALRLAGIAPEELRAGGSPKLVALGHVLGAYQRGLKRARMLDEAEVLLRSVTALESGRCELPRARIHLLPGLSRRGIRGRLLGILTARGAETLRTDGVGGLDVPLAVHWAAASEPASPLSTLHDAATSPPPGTVELFAAATPMDEVREVLRRVVRREIPWDQVEIIASDAARYGAALDALSRRLSIPATYSRGLDNRRTRVGRAVSGFFRWIEHDLSTDVLRGLLESGDLVPGEDSGTSGADAGSAPAACAGAGAGAGAGADPIAGPALARRLRRLRIGWGRRRHLEVIDRALREAGAPPRSVEGRDPGEAAAARDLEVRELKALRRLVTGLLEEMPRLPDRARTAAVRTSPSAIARGLAAFLQHVPAGDLSENTVRQVIESRLARASETLTRETGWESAIGILKRHLRIPFAPDGEGDESASWISTGGRIHLSDFDSGGLAARPFTFVVGMDASGMAPVGSPDPLLTDVDRQRLNRNRSPAPLETSGSRMEERRFRVAALLARLRGEITLSYSAWDRLEGRAVAPAPELLQALRVVEGDPSASYDDLRRALGPLSSALPRGSGAMDGADVWLDALDGGGVLRSGAAQVRAVFPGLDRGLEANEERRGEGATAYDGRISSAPGADGAPPGVPGGNVFSATRLEALGSCPRRYFYRYVLGIRAPDELEWDPETWLNSGERGSLLHRVFERALREGRARGLAYPEEAFAGLALDVLAEEAERARGRIPPPGVNVHRAEMAALRDDVLSFVEMIRARCPSWTKTELVFGPETRDVTLETPVGTVRLRGAIDRIDEIAPDHFRIVDYKTGTAGRYRPGLPFSGGRRIQHVLYTHAAAQLLDRSNSEGATDVTGGTKPGRGTNGKGATGAPGATIEGMEYHFPTRRGENRTVSYGMAKLREGREALDLLFGILGAGHFMTTDDTDDCRYCDFTTICRAEADEYGKVVCAQVGRMKAEGLDLPEHRRLKALRLLDEPGRDGDVESEREEAR